MKLSNIFLIFISSEQFHCTTGQKNFSSVLNNNNQKTKKSEQTSPLNSPLTTATNGHSHYKLIVFIPNNNAPKLRINEKHWMKKVVIACHFIDAIIFSSHITCRIFRWNNVFYTPRIAPEESQVIVLDITFVFQPQKKFSNLTIFAWSAYKKCVSATTKGGTNKKISRYCDKGLHWTQVMTYRNGGSVGFTSQWMMKNAWRSWYAS